MPAECVPAPRRSSRLMCSIPAFFERPSSPTASAWRMSCSSVSRKQVSREAHVLRQLPEQPHIRARLARRLDGLLRQLHKVVSVGALDIGVFQESRCRQNVIRVIGRVVEEEIVHHRKQLRSAPFPAALRSGSGHRAWIRVVHKQRMHSWTIFDVCIWSLAEFCQCLAELRHIYCSRRSSKWRVEGQVQAVPIPACSTRMHLKSKASRRLRDISTRPSALAASQLLAPPSRRSHCAARHSSCAKLPVAWLRIPAPVVQPQPAFIPVHAATRSGV